MPYTAELYTHVTRTEQDYDILFPIILKPTNIYFLLLQMYLKKITILNEIHPP